MTHCHREFFHEQWKVLLDDDFIEAWKHGIVIVCCDGIRRRFYPRIFTYSADYPEKCACRLVCLMSSTLHSRRACNRILIATVRNLGTCPCPRCLVPLTRVHNLGMVRDMNQRVTMARVDDNQRRHNVSSARRFIYELNYSVNSTAVEALLRQESWVPNVVCSQLLPNFPLMLIESRMRFPTDYLLWASICSGCCCQTSCMNSNWGYGERYSFI
jgi:hypothetical protein